MATTNYPVNHPLSNKVWSKRLFREALKETYISRFMGSSKNSLVYVRDELGKVAGDRIRYGLRMQLTGDGVDGDNTLEGNEEALTTYYADLLINQSRHAVRSAGEMSEQRVPFSVREEGADGLRDWWADRIDTAFFNQLAGANTALTGSRAGNNTVSAPTSAAGNTRIFYGCQSTSTTASMTLSNTATASVKGNTMQLIAIDNMVNQAKIAQPLVRPLRINGQSKYVMFLHPNSVRQLRTNAAAGAVTWYDVMRARAEGGDTKENPIYNGALGEYNGVILHESARIPSLPTDSRIKFNIFCGAQAACFATGRRDKDQQMKWTEELFDYENELGTAAAMIWGLQKTTFNSIDFGSMVLLTKSPNPDGT